MEREDSTSNSAAEVYAVETQEQARLLTEPRTKAYLRPFIGQACSVAAAAREVGCRLNTMHYRVKTFLAAGLLEVGHVERRAGRPIRHYRTVADTLVVPYRLMPFATHEESLAALLEPVFRLAVRGMARKQREDPDAGQRIFRTADGTVLTTLTADPGPLDPYQGEIAPGQEFDYADLVLSLDPDAAAQVGVELLETLRRAYRAGREGAGRNYLLQIAFVPVER